LAVGEPVEEICRLASELKCDVIVVGHQQKASFASRWWRGAVEDARPRPAQHLCGADAEVIRADIAKRLCPWPLCEESYIAAAFQLLESQYQLPVNLCHVVNREVQTQDETHAVPHECS
jgi:hypothetical protein